MKAGERNWMLSDPGNDLGVFISYVVIGYPLCWGDSKVRWFSSPSIYGWQEKDSVNHLLEHEHCSNLCFLLIPPTHSSPEQHNRTIYQLPSSHCTSPLGQHLNTQLGVPCLAQSKVCLLPFLHLALPDLALPSALCPCQTYNFMLHNHGGSLHHLAIIGVLTFLFIFGSLAGIW